MDHGVMARRLLPRHSPRFPPDHAPCLQHLNAYLFLRPVEVA
jgi:hypothetical protein